MPQSMCVCTGLPCFQQAWSLEQNSSAAFTQSPPDLCPLLMGRVVLGRKFCIQVLSGSQGAIEAPAVAIWPAVARASPFLSSQLLHSKLQSESSAAHVRGSRTGLRRLLCWDDRAGTVVTERVYLGARQPCWAPKTEASLPS